MRCPRVRSARWESGNAFVAMLKRERVSAQSAIEALRIAHAHCIYA